MSIAGDAIARATAAGVRARDLAPLVHCDPAKRDADYQVKHVAMPAIGCGIGGLARHDLWKALIPYELAPVDLEVVSWRPS